MSLLDHIMGLYLGFSLLAFKSVWDRFKYVMQLYTFFSSLVTIIVKCLAHKCSTSIFFSLLVKSSVIAGWFPWMLETENISHWKEIFVDVPHTSHSLYTWLDYTEACHFMHRCVNCFHTMHLIINNYTSISNACNFLPNDTLSSPVICTSATAANQD